jgi:hypothetical protein
MKIISYELKNIHWRSYLLDEIKRTCNTDGEAEK